MRVLVTGGMGFIGSNFIRYLLERYDDVSVVNLDKLSYGSNPGNLEKVDESRHLFVKGDVRDYKLLLRLLEDVDLVVNFAAETHVDRSISSPLYFIENNVMGTATLLEAVRSSRSDVRVVHISTDEVYGSAVEGSFREDDPLNPSSPYSASKAASDLVCLAYYKTYGLDVVIVRPSNNFGPYQYPEKLIPKTIIRARLGLKIPVYGSGRNMREWTYVMDTCEAIDLVARKGSKGGVYNVSSGHQLSNLEVVYKILDIMGRDRGLVEFVDDRPGHDFRYSIDSSRIREELGWRPRYSFDEALRITVEWYMANEDWWRPLVDDRVLHETPWRVEW